jgi:predicted Zn finger-like uncharacterized protein
MILECPACQSRFNVPAHAIPPAGRTVKCSHCSHVWHVHLGDAVSTPPTPAPKPAAEMPAGLPPEVALLGDHAPDLATFEAALAAVTAEDATGKKTVAGKNKAKVKISGAPRKPREVWPYKIVAPVLAMGWLVLAFFTYFPSWQYAPVLRNIYYVFGVVPMDGVALKDVAMRREAEGQRTRFLITGNIVNNEAKPRNVPMMRVQMRDRDDETTWARDYLVNKSLEPGEVYPFRITNAETNFAKDVHTLVVDVGHPLELLFR